jgi:aldose 1-epimerase
MAGSGAPEGGHRPYRLPPNAGKMRRRTAPSFPAGTVMTGSASCDVLGRLPDGREVHAIALRGADGLAAGVLTWGATLASVEAPDREGRRRNVLLGFDTLDGWRGSTRRFGSTVGRYANRISGGRFVLDGVEHRLPRNEGENTLHGGDGGFDKAVWRLAALGPGPQVELAHVSPDGDQGFPGRLEVRLRFALDGDALRLDYVATTDRATVVNLTNHAYVNLAGTGSGDILDHELQIDATQFLPVDARLVPTGELRDVEGTPFDFRRPIPIGARIDGSNEQLVRARGYDHTWVLGPAPFAAAVRAARVREPRSGRTLEVWTTEPGVQFYSGNFLDGRDVGAGGQSYGRRSGLCLETQHFPDSPNRPDFPSTVLRPGETFRSTTILKFGLA